MVLHLSKLDEKFHDDSVIWWFSEAHILMSLDVQSTKTCLLASSCACCMHDCDSVGALLHVLTQAHKIVCFVLKRWGIAWLILCLTLPSFVIWWHTWIYCTQQSSFLNRSIQFRQIIQNRGKWWSFQSVSSFILSPFAYQEKGVLSTWHNRSLTVIPISSCLVMTSVGVLLLWPMEVQ